MTVEMARVLIIALVAVILFITEKVRLDLVALTLIATLMLSRIITPEEGLSGFSYTATVGAAALNVGPIVISAISGCALLILTGCLTMEEAYQAVEWKIIFLLAGVLTLGVALEKTGTALLLSNWLIATVGLWGPIALVSAFYLITSLLTEAMSNNATAALLTPIAIAATQSLEVDPRPFLMAITFAASTSFMTPVGYQTNTLIYGPGQYTFTDFLRIGAPLNVLFWVLATLFIPVFWPFQPT